MYADIRYEADDKSFVGAMNVPFEEGDTLFDVFSRGEALRMQYRTHSVPVVPMTITVSLEES